MPEHDSSAHPAAADPAPFDPAAESSARDWLQLGDAGDTAESWATAAELFRRAVTPEQWGQSLRAAREPLGALEARELTTARPARELPGAPDGEYVVFQFASRFAHKRAAVETCTVTRETGGAWRAAGYYIR